MGTGTDSRNDRPGALGKLMGWSEEDQRLYAHTKRCMECYWGDPDFRAVMDNGSPDERRKLAKAHGLGIDPNDLVPLLNGGLACTETEPDPNFSRLTKLWTEWDEFRVKKGREYQDTLHNSIPNKKYRTWHARQIARCNWELGKENQFNVHTPVCFELSRGCSVGCWFCGIGAEKFAGVFRRTPENRELWLQLLQFCHDELSPNPMAGFCYWGTEPADNPDYLDFMKDYATIYGTEPSTTTAVPLRKLSWTRSLLDSCGKGKAFGCRFSVTTLEDLRAIHAQFSAEELVMTHLALRNREALQPLRTTGRNRQAGEPAGEISESRFSYDTGTISCVSGFLVNMVTREIKLISPCHSSDRWPLGYRTLWKGTFDDADSFAASVHDAIEDYMPTSIRGDQVVQFNENLTYEKLEDGFRLDSLFKSYHMNGSEVLKILGGLAHQGNLKSAEIIQSAVAQGCNYFEVTAILQHMFSKGLIDIINPEGKETSP